MLTGSTILVLGSDERPEGTLEPGAAPLPARADSILLIHVGFGSVGRLSVLRDSAVDDPGPRPAEDQAAYAFGGAPLMIKTVEHYLGNGLEINHIIEVSFDDFPDFIDALGGIDIKLEQLHPVELVQRQAHSARRRASTTSTASARSQFARVRKNECAPTEDDRQRAARQQQVMSAIRSRSCLHRPSSGSRW